MMRLWPVLAMMMLCAAGVHAQEAPRAAKPLPLPAVGLRIGYVNLTKVLKGYARRGEMESDLRQLEESFKKDLEARKTDVDRMRNEARQLAEDNPERKTLNEKADRGVQQLQQAYVEYQQKLSERTGTMLESLYEDVQREVRALGAAEGYDLILKDQVSEQSARSRDMAVLQISQKVVLYARPEFDLSDRVIERLNAKSKDAAKDAAGEKAKAASPAP